MCKSVEQSKIAVIGLGYVGLPLAVEFSKCLEVIGFDNNSFRVDELRNGHDSTLEVSDEELISASKLSITADIKDIEECNVYIVTVPTPINENKQPDLFSLLKASNDISNVLKEGDVVIYESTVYPGATEDECVPILEKGSGLKFNKGFYVGYSPERINPGDKENTLVNIKKVTSGSTEAAADFIDRLYRLVVTAGTYKASSIKVAEAAKVIENTQRDVNIALVNEISIICDALGVDIYDVIKAASTKWNFVELYPGLVGGHCIGVDPYYLLHKSISVGYVPDVIRSAREINDNMAEYKASKIIKLIINNNRLVKGSKFLIVGVTFKENCPDLRNSKVFDLKAELENYGMEVECFDPVADSDKAIDEHGVPLIEKPDFTSYDAILIAVPHKAVLEMKNELERAVDFGVMLLDMKNGFSNQSIGQIII